MKIGIIGNGYVGGATALLAHEKVSFYVYDTDPEKCSPKGTQLKDLASCNFVFIAVPTPMRESGECATHIVESVVSDLAGIGYNRERIIVKSTVPVGTCRNLGVMFMPEFLTEQNWRLDFLNQKNWILGTNGRNDEIRDEVYRLFESAWNNGALNYRPHMTFSTTEEAELTKYTRNCFLATKVSFFNEIEEFCRKKNINYRKVRELACRDERIGAGHTAVPGPDGKRGFGGTCFPKDMASMLHQIQEGTDAESYIIEATVARNKQVDRTEKDWEKDRGRAIV
jgi:UDPglucose 6-dehydrogenase